MQLKKLKDIETGQEILTPSLNKTDFSLLDFILSSQLAYFSDSKLLLTMITLVKAFKSDLFNKETNTLKIESSSKNFKNRFGIDVSVKTSINAVKTLVEMGVIKEVDKSLYKLTDEYSGILDENHDSLFINFSKKKPKVKTKTKTKAKVKDTSKPRAKNSKADIDEDKLIELYLQGNKMTALAGVFGVHKSVISRRIKKLKETGVISDVKK